jgi:hypothetical protein
LQFIANSRRQSIGWVTGPRFENWEANFIGKRAAELRTKPSGRIGRMLSLISPPQPGRYPAAGVARHGHQPERIGADPAVDKKRFAISCHVMALVSDADGMSKTVGNEMRAEVVTEAVLVDAGAGEAGDLLTGLEQDGGYAVPSEIVRGCKASNASADDCHWPRCSHSTALMYCERSLDGSMEKAPLYSGIITQCGKSSHFATGGLEDAVKMRNGLKRIIDNTEKVL